MKAARGGRVVDYTTLAGLTFALFGIFGGQLLEGGHLGSLAQSAAFLIVFCGTVGAVMVQTQLPIFVAGVAMGRWAVLPPPLAPQQLIRDVVAWAHVARKDGLLALERNLGTSVDAFTRRALQLVVDGAEPEQVRDLLEVEIVAFEERLRQGARIWDAAGGYAPTIGILGAVLGLIHVMENLADPGRLGAGIAVAFVATIYGVGLANLVFLPIASKIKTVIAQQVTLREMLVDGLASIASGDHPRITQSRLEGYLG